MTKAFGAFVIVCYNANIMKDRLCKCGECGIEFERNFFGNYKAQGIKGKKIFCSYKCYNAFLKKQEDAIKQKIAKDFCK